MHSDLPPTRLRGYVQLETPGLLAKMAAMTPPTRAVSMLTWAVRKFAIDNPHYLGPIIVAKGRVHGIENPDPTVKGEPGEPVPVRITFYNLLPTGSAGDLFIPVDETITGSGYGPAGPGTAGQKFTQNRATIHLHGNNTVWISDGNVHQWITPAEETPLSQGRQRAERAGYGPGPRGPGSGCMTFFYTNAQSARLQFYHDHALGITRLNVYAGEAAGYVLTDAVEQDMINGTKCPGWHRPPATCSRVLPDIGIPLIIQDRTFVDAETIYAQDPTWNWGTGPHRGHDPEVAIPTGNRYRRPLVPPCLHDGPESRRTLPARMPSAAGTTAPGSIRRSPPVSMASQWGASRSGPFPTHTTSLSAKQIPRIPLALRPGSRR